MHSLAKFPIATKFHVASQKRHAQTAIIITSSTMMPGVIDTFSHFFYNVVKYKLNVFLHVDRIALCMRVSWVKKFLDLILQLPDVLVSQQLPFFWVFIQIFFILIDNFRSPSWKDTQNIFQKTVNHRRRTKKSLQNYKKNPSTKKKNIIIIWPYCAFDHFLTDIVELMGEMNEVFFRKSVNWNDSCFRKEMLRQIRLKTKRYASFDDVEERWRS